MIYNIPDAATAVTVIKQGLAQNGGYFYVSSDPQSEVYGRMVRSDIFDALIQTLLAQ